MDTLEWFRTKLQHLANETGESWLLLDGFRGAVDYNLPSTMYMMHGVPKSDATPQEAAQSIQEFNPQ